MLSQRVNAYLMGVFSVIESLLSRVLVNYGIYSLDLVASIFGDPTEVKGVQRSSSVYSL